MRPSKNSLSLYTDDELEYFRVDSFDDEVVPFVCDDCENIGGYYAASYQEVGCPHCGGNAHPISRYMRQGEPVRV